MQSTKCIKKRCPTRNKRHPMQMPGCSQRSSLACQTRINNSRTTFRNCCSSSCFEFENAVCFGFHSKLFKIIFEGNQEGRCQKHISDDLRRPGQRPAELSSCQFSKPLGRQTAEQSNHHAVETPTVKPASQSQQPGSGQHSAAVTRQPAGPK